MQTRLGFALLFVFASAVGATSQGQILFNNLVPGAVDARVFLRDTTNGVGAGYTAELLVGGTPSSMVSVGTTAFRVAAPGYVIPTPVTVPIAPGSLAYVQMRAYNGASFATSSEQGESDIFAIVVGGAPFGFALQNDSSGLDQGGPAGVLVGLISFGVGSVQVAIGQPGTVQVPLGSGMDLMSCGSPVQSERSLMFTNAHKGILTVSANKSNDPTFKAVLEAYHGTFFPGDTSNRLKCSDQPGPSAQITFQIEAQDKYFITVANKISGNTQAELSYELEKLPAQVSFVGPTVYTYDGTGKKLDVMTTPSLSVSITYNGQNAYPTNAGQYQVIATVQDDDWGGSLTNTLTITRAPQTITFTTSNYLFLSQQITLTATSTSGLSPTFTITDGQASLAGSVLTATAVGPITLEADQGGDSNYLPAAAASHIIQVLDPRPDIAIRRELKPPLTYLDVHGVPGQTYEIRTTPTLPGTPWSTPIVRGTIDASGVWSSFLIFDLSVPRGFYRAVWIPPP
jgi:hypothetical protein